MASAQPSGSPARTPRSNRVVRPEPVRAASPSVPPDEPTEVSAARAALPGPTLLERLRALASGASVAAVLVMAAVGGREGHRWLVTTGQFGARQVVVEGLVRTSREAVLTAGGISPSRNVLSIDAEASARAIEALPWIAHARVTRRLPDHVEVTVEERTAVAVVSAGGLYLAAADGTLFKRALPGDPSDLPVVTGIGREDFDRDPDAARGWVRDALALLADIDSASLGARSRARVDEVHREPTGDLALVVDGSYVWLGRGPYRAKFTRLRVVLNELRRHGLEAAEVHLESDRHPERITVRPRATGG